MTERAERRLAAILAADVVGYSRLMGEDQARTLAALRQLRQELFEPVVGTHRGHLVKSMGDGWIAEFPSISDAVACAVQVQEGLAAHDLIRLRIGIHTGEVVFEAEDVFGDGVNVAARLEQLAEPGQVLLSDTAMQSLDAKAAGQFGGGESHQLKNIARPVQVWRWPRLEATADAGRLAADMDSLALPDKPSIAVLPFDNMSGDADQEFFADGIVEDIITSLSRFSWLFVIARNSCFTYKGQTVDVKRVGRDLGVRYVLEGSVRRAGRRIRIAGQLIDARTGNHLWAERFEGEDADLFDLQDEITHRIVSSIGPELILAESDRSGAKPTQNLDSWESTNRALALYWRWTRDDFLEAEALAKNAIRLDSHNAEAHALLAIILWSQAISGFAKSGKIKVAEALQLARRAVALDARSARAHAAFGVTLMSHLRYDEALAETSRALELLPGSAEALNWSGIVLAYAGPQTLAIERLLESIRLNPRDPMVYSQYQAIAIANFALGNYEDALDATSRVERMLPEWIGARTLRIASLAELGRLEEARSAVNEARKFDPRYSINYAVIRHPYRDQQTRDGLARALAKAGLT